MRQFLHACVVYLRLIRFRAKFQKQLHAHPESDVVDFQFRGKRYRGAVWDPKKDKQHDE